MSPSDDHLRWLTACRQPKRSEVTISEALSGEAQRVVARSTTAVQIRQALEQVVSEPFQRHCRMVQWAHGRLTIGVDNPGLVYAMRRSMLFVLRDHLSAVLPRVRVREIAFCPMAAGDVI